jgi:hypothetical protein
MITTGRRLRCIRLADGFEQQAPAGFHARLHQVSASFASGPPAEAGEPGLGACRLPDAPHAPPALPTGFDRAAPGGGGATSGSIIVDVGARDLGVLPWQVVEAADGWLAADGGVGAVMVVGMEPLFKRGGASCV